MKTLIQKVNFASVSVNNKEVSVIQKGLLTFIGIEKNDTESQLKKLINKIINYRVFEDHDGKMNLSLKNLNLEHLIISQFTLAADCSKGRRPSFTSAMDTKKAEELYNKAIQLSNEFGVKTFGGKFQAHMQVQLVNDGPVTFLFEN